MKKFVILKNGQLWQTKIAQRDTDVVSKLTQEFEPKFQPKQWRLAGRNRVEVNINSHTDLYEVKLETEWQASKIPPN